MKDQAADHLINGVGTSEFKPTLYGRCRRPCEATSPIHKKQITGLPKRPSKVPLDKAARAIYRVVRRSYSMVAVKVAVWVSEPLVAVTVRGYIPAVG